MFAETAPKRLHPPSTPQPLADADFIKVTSRLHAPDDLLMSYRAITASEAGPMTLIPNIPILCTGLPQKMTVDPVESLIYTSLLNKKPLRSKNLFWHATPL